MSVFGKRPGLASFSAPRGLSLVVYWHVVEMPSLLTYMRGASGPPIAFGAFPSGGF